MLINIAFLYAVSNTIREFYLFIHPFVYYLTSFVSTCSVSGTVPGLRTTAEKKSDKTDTLKELMILSNKKALFKRDSYRKAEGGKRFLPWH